MSWGRGGSRATSFEAVVRGRAVMSRDGASGVWVAVAGSGCQAEGQRRDVVGRASRLRVLGVLPLVSVSTSGTCRAFTNTVSCVFPGLPSHHLS